MTAEYFKFQFFLDLGRLQIFVRMNLGEQQSNYHSVVVFKGLEQLGRGKSGCFLLKFVGFKVSLEEQLAEFFYRLLDFFVSGGNLLFDS